jgi:hypothetical protein
MLLAYYAPMIALIAAAPPPPRCRRRTRVWTVRETHEAIDT